MISPRTACCIFPILPERDRAPSALQSSRDRQMKPRAILAACCALPFLGATGAANAGQAPPWTASFTTRVEALALLQSLNAELLSHDSATSTLDHWCEAHRLASPAKIVAETGGGRTSHRRPKRASFSASATPNRSAIAGCGSPVAAMSCRKRIIGTCPRA